jgi:hypothetical protein
MSTVRRQPTESDPAAAARGQARPALRLVPPPAAETDDDGARTRRVFNSVEQSVGLFSLLLFVGSAIALRESVLRDDNLLFPAGCALFVLSVLLPLATRSRS